MKTILNFEIASHNTSESCLLSRTTDLFIYVCIRLLRWKKEVQLDNEGSLLLRETRFANYSKIAVYDSWLADRESHALVAWYTVWNAAGAEPCWRSVQRAVRKYDQLFTKEGGEPYQNWVQSRTKPLLHPPMQTPWCVEIELPRLRMHSLDLRPDLDWFVVGIIWAQLYLAGLDIGKEAKKTMM